MDVCIVQSQFIENIPVLLVYPKNFLSMKKNQVVFLFHRLLENKESELPFAYQLAKHNYFVVLMDIHGHGERPNSFDKCKKYDFSRVTESVYDTAQEVDIVKGGIAQRFGNVFDMENITCIGVSLGSSVSVICGYLFPYVNKVVSIIAAFDWRSDVLEDKFQFLRMFENRPQRFKKSEILLTIDRYDPLFNYRRLDKLPCSFYIAGALDSTAPPSILMKYLDELKKIYIEKNATHLLSHHVYKKTGHQFTQEMKDDVLHWLTSANTILRL